MTALARIITNSLVISNNSTSRRYDWICGAHRL